MSWFHKKPSPTPAPEPRPEPALMIYASDDLLKRAENIVHFMGYRGAVGGFVLDVYRLLKEYERLDDKAREPLP